MQIHRGKKVNLQFSYDGSDVSSFSETTLHVLQLTSPKVIFCNERSIDVVLQAIHEKKYNAKLVVFGNHPNVISFASILNGYSDSQAMHFRYIETDDMKRTLCILHSSGTTGMPKGVELSNYAMMSIIEENAINLSDTIALWFSSLYWISGTILNLKAINQGAKMIIYPEFDEEMTCILIEKYKVEATRKLIEIGRTR